MCCALRFVGLSVSKPTNRLRSPLAAAFSSRPGSQHRLHRPGGLPQPPHAAHPVEERRGEAGVAKQVVVQEVQVAARQALDLGQGRVDRSGV